MSAQVLVVGAGPTGLLLACELARHGVAVRVIERRAGPSTTSKALAVHARTLEVWEDVGILGEALRRGRRVHGMTLRAGGKRLANVSLDELESPYPFVLVLPQSETEAILEARAAELGVRVEREVELVGLEQDADLVRCTLRRGQAEERASCPWVVACDGAHSTVREQLGVRFEGADVPASFVLADATLECALEVDEVHTWFAPAGPALLVPLPTPGQWRVIVGLAEGQERPPEPSLDYVDALLRERVDCAFTLRDPLWLAGFDVRQRKADRYRVGRVFLAGDAAHCHSPIGGQGMNTGLQDAYNLAWRLALVVRGLGREALLDVYQAEREPVARDLLRDTERGTRVVTLRNPITQAVRNHVGSFLSGLDVVRQRLARKVGELSVHYRGSPLVAEDHGSLLRAELRRDPSTERPSLWDWREFALGPRPGDRIADAIYETPAGERRLYDLLLGTEHVLLLFDGASATPAGDETLRALAAEVRARYGAVVKVHVVLPRTSAPPTLADEDPILDQAGGLHAAFRAGAECLYLIRPDGYLGYRAQPVVRERLLDYLERIFA
ncbi:MAG: FAD-dependent monooxygenase [Planctomycetes bacterium]|nr:FAD-dependent monooxygenase [Planctomycetota bacterium]